MGFRISFITADLPADEFARGMGLEVLGTADEMPANSYWAARKKDGVSVLWCEDELIGYENEKHLKALSWDRLVLYCIVNETVNASTVWAYDGWIKT